MYYMSLITIIIQGLGLVIANPILGKPIEFTPRGETFGIMLGILVGIGLVIFIILGIWKIGVKIKQYTATHWMKETDVIVDRERENPSNDEQCKVETVVTIEL